jgi:Ni,Fe-hydrogenase I cytochrome b subunit
MKAQRLDTIWLWLAFLVGHILLNLSHYFSGKPTQVESNISQY